MPDPGRHVLAHVFKIEIDPYIGRLAVFRVHQGRITAGTQLYVGEGRKPIKAGHLLPAARQAADRSERRRCPGDICAVAKIDEIQFDHILHDSAEDAHVHARPLELPMPVFGLAVQPKKRGDEQKVSDVLHKILAEDPCFRIEHNAQANETVMRGLGELHLQGGAREDGDAVQARARHAAAVDRLPRDHRRRAPKATAATRSRPAAPASSARCSSRSSRCRAARASSSSTA